jgi:hypothetical protein
VAFRCPADAQPHSQAVVVAPPINTRSILCLANATRVVLLLTLRSPPTRPKGTTVKQRWPAPARSRADKQLLELDLSVPGIPIGICLHRARMKRNCVTVPLYNICRILALCPLLPFVFAYVLAPLARSLSFPTFCTSIVHGLVLSAFTSYNKQSECRHRVHRFTGLPSQKFALIVSPLPPPPLACRYSVVVLA